MRGEERAWEDIGQELGMDVLDDEEVEQDEADREVEKIIKQGKDAKRKLTKGKVYLCRTSRT